MIDLKNRGVEDIFIASIDNDLSGFAEAIESIFPNNEIQFCVIHQIRNSQKYLSCKDVKPFMKDLKPVYQASTKELAESHLDQLAANWKGKYPKVIDSWRNWPRLSNYSQNSKEIRRIIYTTNIIEGLYRQICNVTKSIRLLLSIVLSELGKILDTQRGSHFVAPGGSDQAVNAIQINR